MLEIGPAKADAANVKAKDAAGIATFFGLSRLEFDYFLNLVHYSRASSQTLKEVLQHKLNDLKRENEILSRSIQSNNAPDANAPALYYYSWVWMATHIALSIDSYQTQQSLAKRLNLTPQKVRDILEQLREFGFASEKYGKWTTTGKSLHLSETSFMNEMSHRNWRQQAMLDVESEKSSSLHYSSVFAMSKSDAQKLRNSILNMIQDSRELIEASPSEELFCFICDFFEV